MNNGEDPRRQFFLEAAQMLPMLVVQPSSDDVIDAMKLTVFGWQRIGDWIVSREVVYEVGAEFGAEA